MMKKAALLLLCAALWHGETASTPSRQPQPAPLSTRTAIPTSFAAMSNPQALHWADSIMEGLTLRERIAQLFIYKLAPERTAANRDLMRRVVCDYKVGGLLFSGGGLSAHATLTNEAQEMSRVPLLITLDGEWGLSMRLKPSPVFARNRVLGNITNDSLLYAYGREVARECREMGIHANFAPVADVDNNPKNPVINTRSFGEDPHRVARQVSAYARGLQDGGVLAVVKHFPGHGDTDVDSHKVLPVLNMSRARMDSVELVPFRHALASGVDGVMVGHLNMPALTEEKDLPASMSHRIVTGLLTEELGFQGLKFTDALEMKGAVGGSESVIVKSLKAGEDLLLVPGVIRGEIEQVEKAIRAGEISEESINYRCRKVLAYKYALGLSRQQKVQTAGLEQRIATPGAQELVEQLQTAAITATGDPSRILSAVRSGKRVAVLHVGSTAQTIKPFTDELSAHVHTSLETLPAQSTAEGVKQWVERMSKTYQGVIVVVSTRQPGSYRTFFNHLDLKGLPMASVFLTPQRDMERLPAAVRKSDAVIAAHSTDKAVQQQVARVLAGKASATGRLSTSIEGLFKAGDGVDIRPVSQPTAPPAATSPAIANTPATSASTASANTASAAALDLSALDTIVQEGIRAKAYPGCQVVVLWKGQEVYNKSFGYQTYDGTQEKGQPQRRVEQNTVYDLASLTKTTATLLAVMKLYEQGMINLTDPISKHLPYLRSTNKAQITLKDLLFHESGLPAIINYYREAIDPESYTGALITKRRDALHTARISASDWANPNFKYRDGLTSPVRTDLHTLQISGNLWIDAGFMETYKSKTAETALRRRRYTYSDVNFVLLQQMVETLTGEPLNTYVEREFYRPMGLELMGFLPLERIDKYQIAPTVQDIFLRKTLLRGYVHDETAAFQGGVSGNAGLFSNATEVGQVYQMLLNKGVYNGRRYLGESTIKLFTTTQSRISRRGLGFDRPDMRPDTGPCANSAPKSMYGHTGFTGTCVWVDPDNDFVFVFVSNRVHPDPWDNKLSNMDIRTRLQQVVYDALGVD